jgi:amidase
MSYDEMTILELHEKMTRGGMNASGLVSGYLETIEALDRHGPRLNSIIDLNPDALADAARLDAERAQGQVRGLLHGIPIVLKDNIDTADQMSTTAGSLALEGSHAAQDAFLVSRLREAGVVLLGKANLSEWANFRSTRSVSGWSSRGGQTRNPYALDRTPCGSSSGSAVAVAANLCAAAIGTETDGSIICPAHTNGTVGIKPTLGLVSRSGIIPIAHSQDTAGPIARCVSDAAILLGAITGLDPRDPATASSKGNAHQDYTPFLVSGDLKGMRLGVLRKFFGFHPGVDRVIEGCLQVLASLGAELVDPVEAESFTKLGETELEVLNYEFKADLNAYLAGLGPQARVHSLEDVIAFNEKHKRRVMPYFGQERMLAAQEKGPLTEAAYLKALETNHRLVRQEGIDALLQEHHLQALVAPTGNPAWLVDYVNGDCSKDGDTTSPCAVAGYPHITVPAGQIHGLPFGISFMGAAYAEPVLLRIAYAFEQATLARRLPRFKRHAQGPSRS